MPTDLCELCGTSVHENTHLAETTTDIACARYVSEIRALRSVENTWTTSAQT